MKKYIIAFSKYVYLPLLMLLIFSVGVQGQEIDTYYYKYYIDSAKIIGKHKDDPIDTTIAISGKKTELTGKRLSRITSKGHTLFSSWESKEYYDEEILFCYFKHFRTESAEIAYDDSIFACPVCHKFAEHEPIIRENYFLHIAQSTFYHRNQQTICPFCNNMYRGRWIKRTVKEK